MVALMIQRVVVSFLLRSQSHLQFSRVVQHLHILERCMLTSPIPFVSQSRSMYKDIDTLDHPGNPTSYKDYQFNHTPIIYNIMETLKELLNLTNVEVNKLLIVNPQLKKRSRANILDNYYTLLEAGVEKSTIAMNVWLLAHESNKLKEKLDCIGKLKINIDYLVPWLCMTQEELINYVYYTQADMDSYTCYKIEHLARRLECSVKELCELTVRYPFLLKIPVSYIDKKLDILYEYGVSAKNILRDLWVFRYTENHIRQRCELYKDTQNVEIKTWAIRCPLGVISRAIQRNYAKQGLMQHHKTIGEYLMNKLNIDVNTLDCLITKSPGILRINLVKLNTLINLLHKNGITSKEILLNERIFYFSIATIENRIKTLYEKDIPLRFPLLLCGEKVFNRYIDKYCQRQNILQNQSAQCYLINKLNMDEETFDSMLKRWPTILRVNVTKIDELINVLRQNGIANEDIVNHGRIFYSKVNTIRERIDTLKKAGLPLGASVLTYSQKMFDNYVNLHKLRNRIT